MYLSPKTSDDEFQISKMLHVNWQTVGDRCLRLGLNITTTFIYLQIHQQARDLSDSCRIPKEQVFSQDR